ncbi:hypothetical protein GCM10008956_15250 [Deinococcus arenae]|uniref:Uncharacterized protein n=1 Tax=Deinococcus arenae TaxID=1452751 RepID=A0A8H9L662_9DEIO|nr:hypothetical protein [Deinococcus arenae]GGM39733.1 hypothetical protein GCM10008956_15250 [Deinococcus arenae]
MTASRRRASPAARQEVTQALGSIRQQQRDARAYAERWYQALRAWEVIVPPIVIPRLRYGTFCVDNATTMGEGGPDRPTGLSLPCGVLREGEVARLITRWAQSTIPAQREHGLLLERIRQGESMAMLLHHSGRGWAEPRERAMAYAEAVLRLAVILGDPEAEVHVQALAFARQAGTISVSSQE